MLAQATVAAAVAVVAVAAVVVASAWQLPLLRPSIQPLLLLPSL
jgi:hypothetical protein